MLAPVREKQPNRWVDTPFGGPYNLTLCGFSDPALARYRRFERLLGSEKGYTKPIRTV
jgi:hypothetical protein